MMNDYVNKLLTELDEEFESMFMSKAMPEPTITSTAIAEILRFPTKPETQIQSEPENTDSKLDRVISLATKISAERYGANYNPEICLANLLNLILTDSDIESTDDNFFELLNQERGVSLQDALTEFEFYTDNPYRPKAEKILSKIEARKNKM